MENYGQHNLSIALRHILQQIVDSTNPNGHKNTDMTLPHDGYIQRLSWYFECDRCHYRAFYSHEMENHKRLCYFTNDMKSLAKKRKTAAPKRVSSSTHPPTEDSDQDSVPAATSVKNTFPFNQASPSVTPSSSRPTMVHSSGSQQLPKETAPSNIISMEPTDVEFDTGLSSPDYDTPTIPEMDNETQKTLDFDATSIEVDLPAQQSEPQSQPPNSMDAFDPDILEIKIEIDDPSGMRRDPPPLEKAAPHLLEPVSHSDVVFPGISDPTIDSMMSLFGPQPTHHTPSHQIKQMPSSNFAATPIHSRPFGNMPHTHPGLSIGHVTSLKKPIIQRPTPSPMAGGAVASTAKRMGEDWVDISFDLEEDIPLSSPDWSNSQYSISATEPAQQTHFQGVESMSSTNTNPGIRRALQQPSMTSISAHNKRPQVISASQSISSQRPPALKWKGIQTKPASTALTLEQKFQSCQLHDSGMTLKALCLHYNQGKAAISQIIQNKQRIMSEWFRYSNPYTTKKQRTLKSPAYAEINSAMLKWYWESKAAGKCITGVGIQARAKMVAEELGYHTFKASNGWLEYFWKRVRRQEDHGHGPQIESNM